MAVTVVEVAAETLAEVPPWLWSVGKAFTNKYSTCKCTCGGSAQGVLSDLRKVIAPGGRVVGVVLRPVAPQVCVGNQIALRSAIDVGALQRTCDATREVRDGVVKTHCGMLLMMLPCHITSSNFTSLHFNSLGK